jgi:hypothetical protein
MAKYQKSNRRKKIIEQKGRRKQPKKLPIPYWVDELAEENSRKHRKGGRRD